LLIGATKLNLLVVTPQLPIGCRPQRASTEAATNASRVTEIPENQVHGKFISMESSDDL
jgi:hypothetical protein